MRLVIKTSPLDDTALLSDHTLELSRQLIDALRDKGFSAASEREGRSAKGADHEIAIALDLKAPYETVGDQCSVLCLLTDAAPIGPAELRAYDVILCAIPNYSRDVPLALGVIVEAVQRVLAAHVVPSAQAEKTESRPDRFTFPDTHFGASGIKARGYKRALGYMAKSWLRAQAVVRDAAIIAVRSLPRPVQRAGRRAIRALHADRLLPAAFRPHRYPSGSDGTAPSSGVACSSGFAADLQNRNAELKRELMYWRTQSYRLLEELAFLQGSARIAREAPRRSHDPNASTAR